MWILCQNCLPIVPNAKTQHHVAHILQTLFLHRIAPTPFWIVMERAINIDDNLLLFIEKIGARLTRLDKVLGM